MDSNFADDDQSDQPVNSAKNSNFFLTGITYDDFIDKSLFDLLDLGEMPQGEQDEVIGKIMETIQSRVVSRILDILSDLDFEKMKSALESKNEEEFFQIISKNNIDVPQIWGEEALYYKIELVDLVKGNKKNSEEV